MAAPFLPNSHSSLVALNGYSRETAVLLLLLPRFP